MDFACAYLAQGFSSVNTGGEEIGREREKKDGGRKEQEDWGWEEMRMKLLHVVIIGKGILRCFFGKSKI